MKVTDVEIEPISMAPKPTIATTTNVPVKEVVSYQRFGRIDKKNIANPFKCHLCGFSCRFKESLLEHFRQTHPN